MPRKSRIQVGYLVVLVSLSSFVAIRSYPHASFVCFLGFGAISLLSIIVRVGWFVPCTICGVYCGIFVDATTKHGTFEWQMYGTVLTVLASTTIGLVLGILLDAASRPLEEGTRGLKKDGALPKETGRKDDQ